MERTSPEMIEILHVRAKRKTEGSEDDMAGSNTFGGTIKLEGEKAYREAIKQINSDLKVMASEMSKVTAEFSKNDKSASSLTSRNKILAEQIGA